MKSEKGFSAWLITWEWCGDHAKPEEKVVEILSPRISSERVPEIVELIYHRDSSPSEKVAWRLRKKPQAYPAEFPMIEGVKWEGQIHCGHNPWLLARQVDDLAVNIGADGKEVVSWKDRHTVREVAEKIRNMRDGKRAES
jgi:hypothetical protein